jgi:dihydrodipicolinate synthase/N-acetylneuraminate lyase
MNMKTRFPQCMLAACMLPWKEDFTLDEICLREHIQSTIHAGFQHLYLMGTAGEGYAVTDRQFEQVAAIFSEEMHQPGLEPMVGVISLSLQQVIERICFAYSLGIRQFQISLPSWGALSDREMMVFFEAVCGRFPDANFLHYNLSRTKRLLTGQEYRRIAERVPNLVATKNSTSDYARVADLMTLAPNLQHFFLESSFAFGCLFGECSLLCSYGALFPKIDQQLFDLGKNRHIANLMELHRQVNQIETILLDHVTETYIDGAYDKLYVWLRNPAFPLRLLPPYSGFSKEEAEMAQRKFKSLLDHME